MNTGHTWRWLAAVVIALLITLSGCSDELDYRDRSLRACLDESSDERWQDRCYEEHEHWRIREERLKRECIEAGKQVVDAGWADNDWSCLSTEDQELK